MNAQERLAYLLETIAVPSNRGRLTHTWVAENISLTVADGVYAAINSQSQPTALRYVTGNGIDTTAALWKAQATAVAQSNEALAPHLVTLRDFESIYKPRWQSEGYETEPTLEQITKELIIAATRETMAAQLQPLQVKSTAINAWLDVVKPEDYTESELQAYCDSLLASPDGNVDPTGGE